jgi:hypothetical protein
MQPGGGQFGAERLGRIKHAGVLRAAGALGEVREVVTDDKKRPAGRHRRRGTAEHGRT